MNYSLTDKSGIPHDVERSSFDQLETDNDSAILIFKNILERIFMGIFITMFTHEMGVTTDESGNMFKTTIISSRSTVTSQNML